MSVFSDKPVLFRIFIQLLILLGLTIGLVIDRVSEVFHSFEYMNDRCHSPMLCFSVLIAYVHTFGTVICCRCRYAVCSQDICDHGRTVSLNAELKYSPYHSGSFFVNDPLVFIRFGLLVSVRRVRGKGLACLSFCFLDGTDFLGSITSVPVIEQRLFGKGKDKQAEIQYSCGFVAGWLPKS